MKKQLLSLVLVCAAGITHAQAPAIQWEQSYGGSDYDEAHAIQQTADGGYIVAGWSRSNNGDISNNHGEGDFWVVKLDNTGILQWQISLGGSDGDGAWAIQQSTDNGYIIAGSSSSNNGDVSGNHGGDDFWVVKLDNGGALQWQKSLGGAFLDVAHTIQQTTDGGYILAGQSNSVNGNVSGNHGSADFWVVKIDNTGTLQWQKSLGGSLLDIAHSIQQTTDGGYIVAGYSSSNDGNVSGNHGGADYWVVKLDNTGTLQWQKSLGGSGDDIANAVQQTTDGGYIVTGYSNSNDGDVSGNHGDDDY